MIISPILISLICIFSCSKPTTEMLADKYFEAWDSHNVEEMLAMNSDSVRIDLGYDLQFKGKGKFRDLAEYDSVLNTSITRKDIEIIGDTVKFRIIENNDWLKGMGVESIIYPRAEIVFHDGLIISHSAMLADESRERLNRALNELLLWATEHEQEKLRSMMRDGQFVYNAENGRRVLELISHFREYNK